MPQTNEYSVEVMKLLWIEVHHIGFETHRNDCKNQVLLGLVKHTKNRQFGAEDMLKIADWIHQPCLTFLWYFWCLSFPQWPCSMQQLNCQDFHLSKSTTYIWKFSLQFCDQEEEKENLEESTKHPPKWQQYWSSLLSESSHCQHDSSIRGSAKEIPSQL